MKSGLTLIGGCFLFFLCGCENDTSQSLWDQIKELGQEKSKLKQQVESLEADNQSLGEQVKQLSALGSEVRMSALPTLSRMEIGKRTGFFDKDHDGKKEKLIVYIKPFDDTGDVVKAAGSVEVQLWDLGADSGEALLNTWQIGPEELKKKWAGTVMTNYYRLPFRIDDLAAEGSKDLTVKVKFTDYITGKVLRGQKVIGP